MRLINDDNRIIKCEPMNYKHGDFTYHVAQLSPDMHQFINQGLAEQIDQLQYVVSWMINSHITSVRNTIQNYLVVDPEGVEMSDLIERRSVIRLKKGAARSGVERWIKQLDVTDITSGHMADATAVQQLIQVVTGINDNAMGQYSRGRRSAAQTTAVNAGASARLRMQAMLIYSAALEPLGRDMLSNLRDGLDEDQLIRVMGIQVTNPPAASAMVGQQDLGQFLSVDKSSLVGNYDFEQLDMTLPSEKPLIAATLQELLTAMLQNPQAAQILGYDPRSLMFEILELKGIRNPERFMVQPNPQAQQQMQQGQQPAPATNAMTGQPIPGTPQLPAPEMQQTGPTPAESKRDGAASVDQGLNMGGLII